MPDGSCHSWREAVSRSPGNEWQALAGAITATGGAEDRAGERGRWAGRLRRRWRFASRRRCEPVVPTAVARWRRLAVCGAGEAARAPPGRATPSAAAVVLAAVAGRVCAARRPLSAAPAASRSCLARRGFASATAPVALHHDDQSSRQTASSVESAMTSRRGWAAMASWTRSTPASTWTWTTQMILAGCSRRAASRSLRSSSSRTTREAEVVDGRFTPSTSR